MREIDELEDEESTIDHEYTSNIVCPYCGWEDYDSWETSPSEEDIGLIPCGSCDKYFYATRNRTIDYTTQKANYGTCKHCNAIDVPIEDYRSSMGSYTGLCESCGRKEKRRLEVQYFENLMANREGQR